MTTIAHSIMLKKPAPLVTELSKDWARGKILFQDGVSRDNEG